MMDGPEKDLKELRSHINEILLQVESMTSMSEAVNIRRDSIRVRAKKALGILDDLKLQNSNPSQPSSAEALAKIFHQTYERLAPKFGYKTREESARPWEEVPEENKKLMIAVCAEIIQYGQFTPAAKSEPEELSSLLDWPDLDKLKTKEQIGEAIAQQRYACYLFGREEMERELGPNPQEINQRRTEEPPYRVHIRWTDGKAY